ncbi:MAG: UDP-N-acetylmuramoyl-tripeptide--D-alanyl-D-alanine ligase [Cardiobacteriaceae bacterium]|nr:UDP-N-acetylmuramoyl-tripeptide--D-alanyl-D-alanine ligase [Cardiobacteriaceae bacterium]
MSNQAEFASGLVLSLCQGKRNKKASWRAVGVSTDSRKIEKGNLFIALRGDNFDGADFLAEVAKKGAVAALVEKIRPEIDFPQIEVKDTLLALRRLAGFHRRRFQNIKITAITGSNGKTTSKEILGQIFKSRAPTLITEGNLNNDIGVPLTLLALRPEHQFAVVEIGASHRGDIARLMPTVAADCVAVSSIAPAHLQGFGNLDGVIAAKSEIFAKSSAVMVVNADLLAAEIWKKNFPTRQKIHFSLNGKTEVRAENIAADGSSWTLILGTEKADIAWNLHGKHNVANALLAASCAKKFGFTCAEIAAALQDFSLANSRLTAIKCGKHLIFDDTYNANPASFRAGIDLLANYENTLVIAGKMGELGQESEQLHREVREYAEEKKIQNFWSLEAVEYGGENFQDLSKLQTALQELLSKSNNSLTVLVKGSRSAKMERVVEFCKSFSRKNS